MNKTTGKSEERLKLSDLRGGGQGGKRLPPPVPPLFCELSPASCLFSTNLAMLLLLSRRGEN